VGARGERHGATMQASAAVVGSRCSVEWQPGEAYEGVVREQSPDGKMLVHYDDGDQVWESAGGVTLLPAGVAHEDSPDFESVGSDAESGLERKRLPQQSPPRTATIKAPAASPNGGDDNVDHKYAGIVAKIGLQPKPEALHTMSLNELRFLLRKNGTPSHNMLKTPVVRCPPLAQSSPHSPHNQPCVL
jgi:hypothetical protein